MGNACKSLKGRSSIFINIGFLSNRLYQLHSYISPTVIAFRPQLQKNMGQTTPKSIPRLYASANCQRTSWLVMAGCTCIAITVFNYNNLGSALETKTMGSRSVPDDFTLLRLASETTNNDHTKAESKRSFEDNAADTTLSDDSSKTSYTGSISVNSTGVIYPDGHRCDNCLQGKLLVAINKGKPSLPLSVIKYRYMHQTSIGDNFYKLYRLASIDSLSMIFQHRVLSPVGSQM